MAIVLTAPRYSFVQIDEQTSEPCSWYGDTCLPVYNLNDLEFQLFATVTGSDKGLFFALQINGFITTDCSILDNSHANYTAIWTKVTTGAYSNPDIWHGKFVYASNNGFSSLSDQECFYISFIVAPHTESGFHVCSYTCFKKIVDDCFTSVLGYRNNEDAFYFDYSDTIFFNRVRLPLYLHSPTFAQEEKSYSKSDGSTVKRMHRIWKDYKVKTDYIINDWHEKFNIATAHDALFIECSYVGLNNVQFIRTEKIEIGWMEEDSPNINVAQAKTILRIASPLQNINSNCL